jgi:peptidyl-prolyl cis-trans isomerase D
MLDSLRKGAASWVAKFFLLLLIISFGMWGVADRLRNSGGDTLASVGGREIHNAEFQRAYRNQLNALSVRAGRQISSAEARAIGLPNHVLQSLIGGAALDAEAAKLGLGLADKVVAETIMQEPQFRGLSGKFDQKTFQASLREQGLSEQGYAAQERRNALREQILDTVEQTAPASRTLLEAMNRFQNEERVIQYFVVPEDVAGTIDEPSEEQVKSYYDGHKGQFTAPEFRKITVLALTPETYRDNVKVSDDDVKQEFEAHKDKYSEPEQREVQQISFPNLAAAKAAKEKLDQGADFMAVAKEAGFKEDDVNLGVVAKAALADPKVAEAAFSLEKDKVSNPVEGALSTALVRVTGITPAANKTLDDLKETLRPTLALQRAADEISKLYDKIEDERAAGTSLAEVSKKFNMPLFEAVTDRRGRSQEGKEAELHGHGRELIKPAFESGVGVENAAVKIGNKGYAWFDVNQVIPERLKPLAEVRDEAVKGHREDELRSRLTRKGLELVARGANSSDDFAALAKTVNAEVKTTKPLRRGAIEPGLPASAVKQAFAMEDGALAAAAATGSKGRVVFRVEKIVVPKPLDDAAAGAMAKRLENGLRGDLGSQYVAGLERSYGVKVNERVMKAALGGELAEGGTELPPEVD